MNWFYTFAVLFSLTISSSSFAVSIVNGKIEFAGDGRTGVFNENLPSSIINVMLDPDANFGHQSLAVRIVKDPLVSHQLKEVIFDPRLHALGEAADKASSAIIFAVANNQPSDLARLAAFEGVADRIKPELLPSYQPYKAHRELLDYLLTESGRQADKLRSKMTELLDTSLDSRYERLVTEGNRLEARHNSELNVQLMMVRILYERQDPKVVGHLIKLATFAKDVKIRESDLDGIETLLNFRTAIFESIDLVKQLNASQGLEWKDIDALDELKRSFIRISPCDFLEEE